MRKLLATPLTVLLLTLASLAHGASWQEGKNYFQIQPAQRLGLPTGKIAVTEVFSYGCTACNQFYQIADRLKASLPAKAAFTLVPASFNPPEQWPMFQRAYFAAQAMGIAEKTHNEVFKAVWTTGELAIVDYQTNRIKRPPPTIEDMSRFYARTAGVKPADFLANAKSFTVEMNMKRADQWIAACRVEVTPTIVVNGKYRLTVSSAGGVNQLFELVHWLVEKESGAVPAP